MIEEIRKSIDKEIEILREISIFSRRFESANTSERRLLLGTVDALRMQMKSLNNAIPGFLGAAAGEEKKESERAAPEKKTAKEKPKIEEKTIPIVEKKEEFLKELNIAENLLKRVRKQREAKEEEIEEFKSARGYLKWSNKLFLDRAGRLIKRGYFGNLPTELKKSNLDMLFESYVAMMLASVMIAFFAGIVLAVFFMFFSFSITYPMILLYQGSIAARLPIVILIPFILPIVVFIALYLYPSMEKSSISRKIDEEIPFAVIHMSSISGSGIEPTEIFRIIGLSKDYPSLRKEIRKVLNQINIYGYDLVTALNNVSKTTSNPKLAELFGGLSTTINSGGSLSDFFEKRAETLLVGYKLEKEKSIKMAETFMDVYISVVIAAPMILMLMLVMISISGIQTPFSTGQLTLITIGGVALVNFLFLGFLQTKST